MVANPWRHPPGVPRCEQPRAEGRFFLPDGRRLGYAEYGAAGFYVSQEYSEAALNDGLIWGMDAFNAIQPALEAAAAAMHDLQGALPDEGEGGVMGYKAYTTSRDGNRFLVHLFDAATGAVKDFVSGYSGTMVPNLWDRSATVRASIA